MPQYKYQHKATEYLWQIKEKLGKMKTDEKRNWSDEWADWVENMESLTVVKKKKKMDPISTYLERDTKRAVDKAERSTSSVR